MYTYVHVHTYIHTYIYTRIHENALLINCKFLMFDTFPPRNTEFSISIMWMYVTRIVQVCYKIYYSEKRLRKWFFFVY